MSLVPVIISGGAGARLWPVSRQLHPKPFIRLADGRSLIARAFERSIALPEVEEVVTVTNRELVFTTEDEYRRAGFQDVPRTYLLEPEGRDTAAAVAVAALYVAERHGPETIACVFPADHVVEDVEAFVDAVGGALPLARAGRAVVFGIRPGYPETGYGYIEAEGDRVLSFVEKPDRATAEDYVASGRHYWNAGIFAFRAGDMLALMERHCPAILEACRTSLSAAQRLAGAGHAQVVLDAARFAAVPKTSIDYAVMEKAEELAFVPAEMGWSDIGSWAAVADLAPCDSAGNGVVGDAVLVDTANTYVESAGRLVGTVGVSDLIVVDTPDALLVAARDRAQDVKTLFNRLKENGHEAYSLHRTVHRPWGTYTVLEEGERFKIKRIEVKPGERLSLQKHHHRSEHWVVVSGTAGVVNGEQALTLTTNQSTYIPCGNVHRLENPGIIPLVMIEVQSGEYLGEDDIVRLDDAYGRAPDETAKEP